MVLKKTELDKDQYRFTFAQWAPVRRLERLTSLGLWCPWIGLPAGFRDRRGEWGEADWSASHPRMTAGLNVGGEVCGH